MTWRELVSFINCKFTENQKDRPALFFSDEFNDFRPIQTTQEEHMGHLCQFNEDTLEWCHDNENPKVVDSEETVRIDDWYIG